MEIEGPVLERLTARAKEQIRRRARALRNAVPESALLARSEHVSARLLAMAELQAPRGVALFWPMAGRREVDLRNADVECRLRGAALFYPFMGRRGDAEGGFAEVSDASLLQSGGHGFLEPPDGAKLARPEDIDVVVVPALAVSATGHRLGYGAGFYDAVLPRFAPRAFSIVVAYGFELAGELPTNEHDVACDFVLTDEDALDQRGASSFSTHERQSP
jgi:5-formyltetrahydrofolate cyclo-ligase